MPNPFHDEAGRFCSKEEMGAAVDRLATAVAVAGDDGRAGFQERYQKSLDAYFELRREYDAASREVVEIPADWVAAVSSSGLQNPLPDSAAGIEAIYRSGLSDELRKSSAFHTPKAIGLLTNEHTPEWIKNEIYREASPEIKAGIIEELSREGYLTDRDKYSGITSEELLPFTWGDNGHNPKVTRALLASSKLGFDTKYSLAKDRGQLGALISSLDSARQSRTYNGSPEIELDLRREWKSPLRPQESRDAAARALARNTQSPELRAELLGSDSGAVVRGESVPVSLAQNLDLTEAEGLGLLRRTLAFDGQNFGRIYSELRENPSTSNLVANDYHAVVRGMKSTKDYRGVSDLELGYARQKVFGEYSHALEDGVEKYPGFNQDQHVFTAKVLGEKAAADYWHQLSVIDAEPQRYAELQKESKRLLKEIRPAARKGGSEDFYEQRVRVQGRLKRAHDLRAASLVMDQLEYAATMRATA